MTDILGHSSKGSDRMAGKAYADFIELVKEYYDVGYGQGWLQWDQEVMMPEGGAAERANQLATLAKLAHGMLTSDRMGSLLKELDGAQDLSPEEAANVREVKWMYDRAVKMPPELVKELTKHSSLAMQAWQKARKANRYKDFEPFLQHMIDLKCQQANAIGYEDVPYDALLDEYEPGARSRDVVKVFDSLQSRLTPIVKAIVDSDVKPDEGILTKAFPIDKQRDFGNWLVQEIGYDYKHGRTDVSAHPFTTGSIQDVRFTTRFQERDIRPALFANIHEAGHAIYQQGIDPKNYGTPMGDSVSLGIHESQSRFWENVIGRSKPFWRCYYPDLKKAFPRQFKNVRLPDFYAAVNLVRPSLIRVEADEVTYSLHIMLRFDIERKMVNGELCAKDVPEVWNEKMRQYLGITPPNDADGCMQDIHWSMGYQGYFPTYALGNIYAAQITHKMERSIRGFWDLVERGEFKPIKGWLNRNIHAKGRLLRAEDLMKSLTGEGLNADHYISYIKNKFGPIYDVKL